MYKNKLNGKIASNVRFEGEYVRFTIDGIDTTLVSELFVKYYESLK